MAFTPEDLVWAYIMKDQFTLGKFGTLKPRVDGPFKISEGIGENAYRVELPEEYETLKTLNVKDLQPYH